MELWLLWIVLGALLLWAVFLFNRLVRLRNQMRTAWADIDVQLMRRHDLVPQLVTAVQAYADHERSVLTAVTELRATAMVQAGPASLFIAEAALEQGLARVFGLQENYPDLKASENFRQLQAELVEVENQLQYARRFYNGAVRDNNDAIARIPDVLIARPCRFEAGEFYQAAGGTRGAVKLELP